MLAYTAVTENTTGRSTEIKSQRRGRSKCAHFGGNHGLGCRVFSYPEGSPSFLTRSETITRREMRPLSQPLLGGLRSGLWGKIAPNEDHQSNVDDVPRIERILGSSRSSCMASHILELAHRADRFRSHGMLRRLNCNYEHDNDRHVDILEIVTNNVWELRAQDPVTLGGHWTACRSRTELI